MAYMHVAPVTFWKVFEQKSFLLYSNQNERDNLYENDKVTIKKFYKLI